MKPIMRWEIRAVPLPGTTQVTASFAGMLNEHPRRFLARTMAVRAADRDEHIIGDLVNFTVVDRWAE